MLTNININKMKEVLHALLHRAKKWIRKKFGAEYEEMQDKDGRIP